MCHVGSPAISCSHPREQKESYGTKTCSGAGNMLPTLMLRIRKSCIRGMVSIIEAHYDTGRMHANILQCSQRASTPPIVEIEGRKASLHSSFHRIPLHSSPLSPASLPCCLEWGCIWREEQTDEVPEEMEGGWVGEETGEGGGGARLSR